MQELAVISSLNSHGRSNTNLFDFCTGDGRHVFGAVRKLSDWIGQAAIRLGW